jgi:hypothetical protein
MLGCYVLIEAWLSAFSLMDYWRSIHLVSIIHITITFIRLKRPLFHVTHLNHLSLITWCGLYTTSAISCGLNVFHKIVVYLVYTFLLYIWLNHLYSVIFFIGTCLYSNFGVGCKSTGSHCCDKGLCMYPKVLFMPIAIVLHLVSICTAILWSHKMWLNGL